MTLYCIVITVSELLYEFSVNKNLFESSFEKCASYYIMGKLKTFLELEGKGMNMVSSM